MDETRVQHREKTHPVLWFYQEDSITIGWGAEVLHEWPGKLFCPNSLLPSCASGTDCFVPSRFLLKTKMLHRQTELRSKVRRVTRLLNRAYIWLNERSPLPARRGGWPRPRRGGGSGSTLRFFDQGLPPSPLPSVRSPRLARCDRSAESRSASEIQA